MSTSFERASEVSKKSIALVLPLLISRGWTLEPYRTSEEQLHKGDYRGCHEKLGTRNIELKAEKRYTGNLFIETWSNYPHRSGWLSNLTECSTLIYHFLSTHDLYVVDMKALRSLDLSPYREVQQSAYEQQNDSRGRLVPISDLKGSHIITWTGKA